MFFSAKPVDEAVFDALRKEAAEKGDIVVLPGIFEHYNNITHQTLEILRAASMDPVATHTLKVQPIDSYCAFCVRNAAAAESWVVLCQSLVLDHFL